MLKILIEKKPTLINDKNLIKLSPLCAVEDPEVLRVFLENHAEPEKGIEIFFAKA